MIRKQVTFLLFCMVPSVRALAGQQYIGFDLGTSGARISVTDGREEVYNQAISWDGAYDDPVAWKGAVETLLDGAAQNMGDLSSVASICVSGTSASCLVIDGATADVTRSARMYNYAVEGVYGSQALDLLDKWAPPKHTARSATGTLAKLLSWHQEKALKPSERLCHQADYISVYLMSPDKKCGANLKASPVCSDWHNCLKLGYDVRALEWPKWMIDCLASLDLSSDVLPSKVVSPGEPLGSISADVAKRFGLSEGTIVVGGTTDSNAAFFAATGGSGEPGTTVTSLGSTLAIKQVSSTYVEDASLGVYSHRFPSTLGEDERWLVGGASNVGCAVLRQQEFSTDELVDLSKQIDPNEETSLKYYPLIKAGERFPIADSDKQPLLTPRPEDRASFLHGILQGISDVERDGLVTLGDLGATPKNPSIVWTCGGGSRNDMWSEMRQRRLREAFGSSSLVVEKAANVEASYGAAVLAASSMVPIVHQ